MTPLPSPTLTPLPTPTPTPTPTPGPPARIEIKKLRISRAIIPVGLISRGEYQEWDAERLFATTNRKDLVGHLEGSGNPGQPGNVVLIGHNYNRGVYNWLGVFYSIHRLKEGDLIQVINQDDDLFTYRVVDVDKVPWRSNSNAGVLEHIAHVSQTRDETLTLITCGGANFAPFPSRIYVTAKRVLNE